MSAKENYIVSNTLTILPSVFHIISHDLHKRHGRYTYQFPQTSTYELIMGMGVATETETTIPTGIAPLLTVTAISTLDIYPIISGTSDAVGSTVFVFIKNSIGEIETIEAIIQPDGTFSAQVLNALPLGEYLVYLTVSSKGIATVFTDTIVR